MNLNGTRLPALELVQQTGEDNDITRMNKISFHFRQIMEALGLDLEDDSLRDTPNRVARMYVKEIFSGLDEKNAPSITLFENKYNYGGMVLEKNISIHSWCEHHFVPITGRAHVAYISSGRIIGLSKLNRIVQFFSKRPQVQERLTMDIAEKLKEVLQTPDVAVVIEAVHHCVAARGVEDGASSTYTAHFSGKFGNEETRREFQSAIKPV